MENYGQTLGVLAGGGGKIPRMFIKKSIMGLILYDAQNLLPLFRVHYILENFYLSLLKVVTTLPKEKFEELISGESEEVMITHSYTKSKCFIGIQDYDFILRRRGKDHERCGNLVRDLLK